MANLIEEFSLKLLKFVYQSKHIKNGSLIIFIEKSIALLQANSVYNQKN